MRIRDLITVSIRNLWRRKHRTSLTILGVVIGTTSIVLMVSLGIAMNENFMNEIERMGSLNTINVYPSYQFQPGSTDNEPQKLTDSIIEEFKVIPGVLIASPVVDVSMKMTAGKYVSWIQLKGIDLEILKIQNVQLEEGRMLEPTDKLAFLFGAGVPYNFYNPSGGDSGMYYYYGEGERPEAPVNLMEDKLKASFDWNFGEKPQPGSSTGKPIRPYKITAVGILSEGQGEHDYNVYTTLEQAKALLKEQKKYEESNNGGNGNSGSNKRTEITYNNAIVQVEDMKDVKSVQDTIKAYGFEAYSLMEYLDSMQNTSNAIQLVLGGIGAVSLLVAAIGITNTMIMSIYERTKEIGVMKVIGAKLKDIKKMFLIEAALIGFFGGGFGLLISYGGSKLLNYVGRNFSLYGIGGDSKLSVVPLWLYVLAISFTTLIGLISGYLPAVRAMKLSVLNALRTE